MPPNPAASDPEAKKKAARETIDILHEISTLLVRPDRQPIYSEREQDLSYHLAKKWHPLPTFLVKAYRFRKVCTNIA